MQIITKLTKDVKTTNYQIPGQLLIPRTIVIARKCLIEINLLPAISVKLNLRVN